MKNYTKSMCKVLLLFALFCSTNLFAMKNISKKTTECTTYFQSLYDKKLKEITNYVFNIYDLSQLFKDDADMLKKLRDRYKKIDEIVNRLETTKSQLITMIIEQKNTPFYYEKQFKKLFEEKFSEPFSMLQIYLKNKIKEEAKKKNIALVRNTNNKNKIESKDLNELDKSFDDVYKVLDEIERGKEETELKDRKRVDTFYNITLPNLFKTHNKDTESEFYGDLVKAIQENLTNDI